MDIEPRLTIRTLEELLAGSYVGCRYETTFESIEVLGDVEKPSLEVFKTKYDDLKNRVVPLEELRLERSYKLTNSDWTWVTILPSLLKRYRNGVHTAKPFVIFPQ